MKRLTITGNIGRDPELRLDQNGVHFAVFSVAVSVGNKQMPKTDWVEVSCNGRLAEIVTAYARKGSRVLVDGYPNVNAYINKENQPIGNLRLFANSIELLNKVALQEPGNDEDIHCMSNESVQAAPDIPF
ncbi:MAG: single-stranded DNA-binding protein [Burkholderiales bacterium]|nr:single-stranded DNA-binding protein [Burkholderiales bacterium]